MNKIRPCAATALLFGALGLTAQSQAQTQTGTSPFEATTLTLSARGEIQTAPDQAVVTLGVQADAATAGEAMRRDAAQMTAVLAALRQAGAVEKDIQTSNLSLSAHYDDQQGGPPRLTGYVASNQVIVIVRDLTRLGPTVDASVSAGANQVEGIGFGLKDPKAAEDAARKAAVIALRDKAELYAAAAGYHVSRLVTLSEGGGGQVVPMGAFAMTAMRKAAAPTPVAPGELAVSVDVTATYELAR